MQKGKKQTRVVWQKLNTLWGEKCCITLQTRGSNPQTTWVQRNNLQLCKVFTKFHVMKELMFAFQFHGNYVVNFSSGKDMFCLELTSFILLKIKKISNVKCSCLDNYVTFTLCILYFKESSNISGQTWKTCPAYYYTAQACIIFKYCRYKSTCTNLVLGFHTL